MTHAVFLDTMIYLHYKPVDQIDWHEALGLEQSAALVIVVPGITLREIDKHKNETPRLRERAQRVSEQLVRLLSTPSEELRPNVRIVGALRAPRTDMASLGLDPALNDDVLLAAALSYQDMNPGVAATVVSDDGYMRIRAAGLEIDSRVLSNELRLKLAEDPLVKENRELQRENQQMRARRPKLDLELADGGGKKLLFTVHTVQALSPAELGKAMGEVEQTVPPTDSFRPKPPAPRPPAAPSEHSMSMRELMELTTSGADVGGELQGAMAQLRRGLLGIPEDELTRYERERTDFLDKYATFFNRQRKVEQAQAHNVALRLRLTNDGSVPAEDIDVNFHIPNGMKVSSENLFEDVTPPKRPKPPRARGPLFGSAGFEMPSFNLSTPVFPSGAMLRGAAPSNVSSLRIRETESFDVHVHVAQVKHGLVVELPVIYLLLQPGLALKPFQVTYSLHAANEPEPVTGAINIVLSDKAAK
jgi:hypothetical protein